MHEKKFMVGVCLSHLAANKSSFLILLQIILEDCKSWYLDLWYSWI